MKKHLGAAVWILVVGGLHAWWLVHNNALNGDLLYFESILQDARMPTHARSGFQYTEAIFAFPDFLLFYFIRLLVIAPAWAVASYKFALTLAQGGLLYALWIRIWPGRSLWSWGAVLSVFFFLTDTTWRFSGLPTAPEHHGAIYLLQLLWTWQIVDLLEAEKNLARWLGLNFVVMLGLGFSDLLVFPSVLVPGLLLLGALTSDRRLGARAYMQVVLVNVLGVVGGMWIKFTLVSNEWIKIDPSNMITLSARGFITASQRFVASLVEFAEHDWFFFSVLIVLALMGRKAFKSRTRWHNVFLALALTIFATKITAILVNGRWDNVSAVRYLQELFLFPLTEVCLFLLPTLLTRARARVLGTSLIALSLVVLILPPRQLQLTEKPEFTRCLEQHRSELPTPWGLGDFWISKLVTFTSSEKLVVNQVKQNFSRYYWMNSPVWYHFDIWHRPIEKYTYAVAFDFAAEIGAVGRYGPPASRFVCPFESRELAVLIYPAGIEPAEVDHSRVR